MFYMCMPNWLICLKHIIEFHFHLWQGYTCKCGYACTFNCMWICKSLVNSCSKIKSTIDPKQQLGNISSWDRGWCRNTAGWWWSQIDCRRRGPRRRTCCSLQLSNGRQGSIQLALQIGDDFTVVRVLPWCCAIERVSYQIAYIYIVYVDINEYIYINIDI